MQVRPDLSTPQSCIPCQANLLAYFRWPVLSSRADQTRNLYLAEPMRWRAPMPSGIFLIGLHYPDGVSVS